MAHSNQRPSSRSLRATPIAAAAWLAAAASAQTPATAPPTPAETQLAPVVVSGRAAPVASVSGWGDVPLARTPVQASVFGAELIQDTGARRLADLISYDAAVSDAYNTEGYWDYLVPGLAVALVMVAEMAVVLGGRRFGLLEAPAPMPRPAGYSNTQELGQVLYTHYVYPFEIAAVILLVAIVAAIALTLRRRPDSKYQDPSRQVVVRKQDRIRIVNVPTEKKVTGD